MNKPTVCLGCLLTQRGQIKIVDQNLSDSQEQVNANASLKEMITCHTDSVESEVMQIP